MVYFDKPVNIWEHIAGMQSAMDELMAENHQLREQVAQRDALVVAAIRYGETGVDYDWGQVANILDAIEAEGER